MTPFAVFHQRYATNTLPTWHRAQPGRMLAHNGEINTVWGNRARMAARDSTLPVECKPVLTQGGTDSTSLDEAVELLSQNGRTLAEAIRMLLPPAADGHHSFFVSAVSHGLRGAVGWAGGDCVQRWASRWRGAGSQWSAALPICDHGRWAGGCGLGGGVGGSRSGEVTHSGRLGPGQMLVVDLESHKVYEDEALLELFDAGATYAKLVEDTPLVAGAGATALDAARVELRRSAGLAIRAKT